MAVSGHKGRASFNGVDLQYLTAWTYSETADTLEKTAMSDEEKSYITALKDGTVTIEGWFNVASGTAQKVLRSATTGTVLLSTDKNAVAPYALFSGTCAVESFELNGSNGSIVSWSATLRGVLTEVRIP